MWAHGLKWLGGRSTAYDLVVPKVRPVNIAECKQPCETSLWVASN